MNLTISDTDIAELANKLQVAVDEACQKGVQAERERIRAKVLALGKDWVLDTTTKQYADLLLEDN